MKTFKSKGLVIKEKNYNESDKIVTLLLKQYGKVTVFSKGARNTKSKFLVGTQLFSYSDFTIIKGTNFNTSSEIDLIKSFYKIGLDYEKFYLCSYFFEMIDKTLMENVESDNILLLTLKTLNLITNNMPSSMFIYSVFNIKFLQILGYTPKTIVPNQNKSTYFFNEYGVVLEDINKPNYFKVSSNAINILNYILNSDLDMLYYFTESYSVINELKFISRKLIEFHLDITIDSLKYLELV